MVCLGLDSCGYADVVTTIGQGKNLSHTPGKVVGIPGAYENRRAAVVQYLLELFEPTCDYRTTDSHVFEYFGRRAEECSSVRRNMRRGEHITS